MTKFKILLTINAVLAAVSGIACMVMPDQLLAHYDVNLPSMGLVVYQFWGATLLGLGLLIWLFRDTSDHNLQWKISLSLFITNALCCVMAVRGQYAGANSRGWSMVILFGLFALIYGVLALMKPRKTPLNDEKPG